MFIDEVTIKVESGNGGNGVTTFRQEKFVAYGGPDGGDGGRGGDVYLEACSSLNTLLDFKYISIYKADDGVKGARGNCNGKAGKDLIVKVPCGTIVSDPNEDIIIADLKEEGQQIMVAKGGRGGKGNAKFKSQKLSAPHFCEPGEPSIEREIKLELKMIADVGIIGFPNAGKSTLISKLSAAKPKIANYAFTTIAPNLGVVKKPNGEAFVLADIPGLITGASEGQGLGHDFLRHIERCKFLVHMVDAWGLTGDNIAADEERHFEDPLTNFQRVNFELDSFSPKLAMKKQMVVINKIEAYPEDEQDKLMRLFQDAIDEQNKAYFPAEAEEQGFVENPPKHIDPKAHYLSLHKISAVSGNGIEEFTEALIEAVDNIAIEEEMVEIDFDHIAEDNDDSEFEIEKVFKSDLNLSKEKSEAKNHWNVYCGKLERIMRLTDLRSPESLRHLFNVAKSLGVFKAIKSQGANVGDILVIDGAEFEVNEILLV